MPRQEFASIGRRGIADLAITAITRTERMNYSPWRAIRSTRPRCAATLKTVAARSTTAAMPTVGKSCERNPHNKTKQNKNYKKENKIKNVIMI